MNYLAWRKMYPESMWKKLQENEKFPYDLEPMASERITAVNEVVKQNVSNPNDFDLMIGTFCQYLFDQYHVDPEDLNYLGALVYAGFNEKMIREAEIDIGVDYSEPQKCSLEGCLYCNDLGHCIYYTINSEYRFPSYRACDQLNPYSNEEE